MPDRHRRPPVAALVLVVLAVVAALAAWWWQSSRPDESTGPLSASGEIEATEYQVAPAIAGRVTSVPAAEGDTVAKGDVLVRLDRAALVLQRDQAEQGVTAARAALEEARDDGTAADVTAARARLAQARAGVDLAEVQLGYARVTAPHDGVVVSVITNAGQNGAPGRTLLTLVDPADLSVRVYVPETRIGQVRIGQDVTVSTDSGITVPGQVATVASSAEFTPNTVQTEEQRATLVYAVRVRVDDDSGALKSGMPVDVLFD